MKDKIASRKKLFNKALRWRQLFCHKNKVIVKFYVSIKLYNIITFFLFFLHIFFFLIQSLRINKKLPKKKYNFLSDQYNFRIWFVFLVRILKIFDFIFTNFIINALIFYQVLKRN